MGIFTKKVSTVAVLPGGSEIEFQVWNEKVFQTLSGGRQSLGLERDATNKSDKNAIRVSCERGWIGYLPREQAKLYARLLDTIPVPICVSALKMADRGAIYLPPPAELSKWITSQRFG